MSALHALSANPDFQARLRRVFITVGQASDHELMPYTFRPDPGHDSIQKLGRMDMRPAVDTFGYSAPPTAVDQPLNDLCYSIMYGTIMGPSPNDYCVIPG